MDSSDGVYMDFVAVRDMAKNFGSIGDVLKAVNQALAALANLLRASAFIGAVGLAAYAGVIDGMRPRIETFAEKCEEYNKDLEASANAYEQGDELGSTRFH